MHQGRENCMARLSHKTSAVEKRKLEITRQLEHLHSQLAKKSPASYANENIYRRQLKRSRELISELEGELLILDDTGEYDELPSAVVADELGLKCEQVRSLIKLGEIAATGDSAHERISRGELERIINLGVPELLRLGREESVEIYEQAVPHLQGGDLEAAGRAYRRLERREGWKGHYAPAFLVGLELASGDLDAALSSFRLLYEYEDPLQRTAVMAYLGRLLRWMRLDENNARELCDQLIRLAEVAAGERGRFDRHWQKRPKKRGIEKLQRRAMYLTISVMRELRKCEIRGHMVMSDVLQLALEEEIGQLIRNAIYTAIYSETYYESSSAGRIYLDIMMSMIPKSYQPATLLEQFFGTSIQGSRH